MKSTFSRMTAVALLACAAAASAQTPPPAGPGAQPPGMQMRDHGQMQQMHQQMQQHMQQRRAERHQQRMESLKRILQITPQQEGAFTAWSNAMRPAARQRPDRSEFARLSTPERIDRMKQMRAQRAAEQDRRGDATKQFYAQLTPAQQKAFDEVSLKMLTRGGRGGHGGGMHGHHG